MHKTLFDITNPKITRGSINLMTSILHCFGFDCRGRWDGNAQSDKERKIELHN